MRIYQPENVMFIKAAFEVNSCFNMTFTMNSNDLLSLYVLKSCLT